MYLHDKETHFRRDFVLPQRVEQRVEQRISGNG